jgi:DDE superfamily endonuclease
LITDSCAQTLQEWARGGWGRGADPLALGRHNHPSRAAPHQHRRSQRVPACNRAAQSRRRPGRRLSAPAVPYLNNALEQDHRAVMRRVNASQGFRSFWGAWRTLAGYEVIHMIRKGQAWWECSGGEGRSTAPLHFRFVRCKLAKFPINYPDLRLDYKVATHPYSSRHL